MRKAIKKIDLSDLEEIKKRFLLVNEERLQRSIRCMRLNQRDFIDFIPLLFHINHPALPGYTSNAAPCGIFNYTPPQRALTAAAKYVSQFNHKKQAMARYDIVSVFLMGSSGSVAYNPKSDFDIWLCYRRDLGVQALEALRSKASAIESWAAGQGFEVHVFLMDPDSFRRGEVGHLSSESSGSAQYYLLLEEFYRTSLLLAGRFPVWWLVPVDEEGNYEEYVQALYDQRLVSDTECVDFGAVPTVPAEEFFGAALWQLFKGIDSPYKSVLKLMLMEVYASEYPHIELLCMRFKKAVHYGEEDLDKLDPYIMLYKRLEEYLLKRKEEERLEVVKRCFYFKVNQRLSHPDTKETDWRREVMAGLVASWGWDRYFLSVLDGRHEWKIQQVLKERGALVKELIFSYHFLSDFARSHAQLAAINQQDLNVLGRKLYAAFERKSGKVEIANRGISRNVEEPLLIFYQINKEGSEAGWAVLKDGGSGSVDVNDMVPLKRERHLSEAVAWAHCNGLISPATGFRVMQFEGMATDQELQKFFRALDKYMPRKQILETDVDDLGRPARVLQTLLVVNLGRNAFLEEQRGSNRLASNRTDAFSYGGVSENLVMNIDQISINSWKEVVTAHYKGIEGVLACLSHYMKWMLPSKGGMPQQPVVLCFSDNHMLIIKQRVEGFFKDVLDCFYSGDESRVNNRYLFAVKRSYYVLYLEDDTLRFQRIPNHNELMRYLGRGRQTYGRVVIDTYAMQDSLLPLIYKMDKPDTVQLFYQQEGNGINVFIIDERGALFQYQTALSDARLLLGHFKQFFESIKQRQRFRMGVAGDKQVAEFYRLFRDRHGEWSMERSNVSDLDSRGYFNVQVLAEEQESETSTGFKIFCEDKEFSSLEYGSNLFREAAAYIIQQRGSGQPNPIFITDIDLPAALFREYPDGRPPLVEFLNYKRSIEGRLNRAVEELSRGNNVRPLRPR